LWQIALLGTDERYRSALEAVAGLHLAGGGELTDSPSCERALADARVAAVAVATPVHQRRYWIERALDQGKHVLCELPLTGSARESLLLARRARHSAGHLVVGGDLASLARARDLTSGACAERLGAPVYLRLGMRLPRADVSVTSLGVLAGFGIRIVRLAALVCGRLDTAYARARSLGANRPVEDCVVALLRFVNGCEGLVQVEALGERAGLHLALTGSRGATELDFDLAELDDLSGACLDLKRVLEGGEPECGAHQLHLSALLVEWIMQAARTDREMARADVTLP